MTKQDRLTKTLIGAGLLFLALSGNAAASYQYDFDAGIQRTGQFESEMAAKLNRGIVNIMTGWMEIFRTPVEWARHPSHSRFAAVTLGFPLGIMRAVKRTLVGAYEVATPYVPQDPIMEPLPGEVV